MLPYLRECDERAHLHHGPLEMLITSILLVKFRNNLSAHLLEFGMLICVNITCIYIHVKQWFAILQAYLKVTHRNIFFIY